MATEIVIASDEVFDEMDGDILEAADGGDKVYADLSAVPNFEDVGNSEQIEVAEPEVHLVEEDELLEDDEIYESQDDGVDEDPELSFETKDLPKIIIRQKEADAKSARPRTKSPPLKRVTRGKKGRVPVEVIDIPSDDEDDDVCSSEDEWQPPQADEADAKWAFEQVRSMVDRAMANAAEKLRSEMTDEPKRKFGTRVLAKSRGVKQVVTVVRDKVIDNPSVGPQDLRTDRVIPDFLEFHRFRAKGYGVLAKLPIDIGVRFGPYAGVIRKMKNVNSESGYAWQLRGFKEGETVVDGFDVKHANWLRYVNCSNSAEEANLRVFQHEKRIYYKTCKPIVPGDELLVWYGKEYREVINSQIEIKKRKREEKVVDHGAETFKCPHCQCKMLVKSTFERHVKKCGKNPNLPKTLKCPKPDCGFFTVHEALLEKHTSNPKHVNVTVHRCRWKCGYRTFNELRYRLHLERRHKSMEFPDAYDIECKVCGQRFPSKNAMDIHSQWHRKNLFFCNVCGKGYTTIGILKEHAQMHEGKNFKCLYEGCGYATYCKRTLNRHNRCVHLKIRTAFCDLCSKSFFCKKDLRQHQNKLHNVFKIEKTFRCRPHKVSYATAEELQNHKEQMFPSFKPRFKYQCEYCCYSTAYPSTFKTHQSCHTEERNFACDQCDKTFKLQVSLKEHQLTHENADPDRFVCLHCQKRCRTNVELRSHKRRCRKAPQTEKVKSKRKPHLREGSPSPEESEEEEQEENVRPLRKRARRAQKSYAEDDEDDEGEDEEGEEAEDDDEGEDGVGEEGGEGEEGGDDMETGNGNVPEGDDDLAQVENVEDVEGEEVVGEVLEEDMGVILEEDLVVDQGEELEDIQEQGVEDVHGEEVEEAQEQGREDVPNGVASTVDEGEDELPQDNGDLGHLEGNDGVVPEVKLERKGFTIEGTGGVSVLEGDSAGETIIIVKA